MTTTTVVSTMTEQELVDVIVETCKVLRLKVCHFRPARTAHGWRTAVQGDSGYPDLTIAGPRGVLHRECKSAKGKVTPEQTDWLEVLGGDVWRPCDWTSGRIEAELRLIAREPATAWRPPTTLDPECLALSTAMNEVPGITTKLFGSAIHRAPQS